MNGRSNGDRTAARGKLFRAASRFALAAAAAGLVAFAAHARSLGARLDRLAVVPGASPTNVPDPTAPGPFAPFAFGLVGPVRGDAAALERAVEALAAEGAAFVVLVGDVTGDGTAAEVRRLALACRDRGPEIVAVAGPRDLSHGEFAAFVSAPRWWFRHRDVLVVGVPGSRPEDEAWLRGRLAESAPSHATVVVAAEPASLATAAGTASLLGPGPGARIVEVGAERIDVREVPLPGGPPVGTWVRGAALLVEPLLRPTSGHAASLALATVLLAAALWGLRIPAARRGQESTTFPSPR